MPDRPTNPAHALPSNRPLETMRSRSHRRPQSITLRAPAAVLATVLARAAEFTGRDMSNGFDGELAESDLLPAHAPARAGNDPTHATSSKQPPEYPRRR